jgi:peptidoglycan/LPS O-acetylase OafA/YrhL
VIPEQPATAKIAPRDVNLDRLRAAAIALVVIFHVTQMWPTYPERLARFTKLGAYGVDLFFVLSGWLVGGLFWKEQSRRGTVDVTRFILRRVLRTVPCYLVALLLSWGAVRVTDPQRAAFDPAYLFFLQNYKPTMPYFLVSWSLCIEEHFYLLMPVAMMALCRFWPRLIPKLWPLCLVPLLLRALAHGTVVDVGTFGPAWTSTHLRFEGLLAGVLAARMSRNDGPGWHHLVRWSRMLVVPSLAATVALFFASPRFFYLVGLTLLAVGFLSLLISLVGAQSRGGPAHPLVKSIALGSYSAYLTHALMIHVARLVITRMSITSTPLRLIVFATTIVGGAIAFYRLIERPSLSLRDRVVPAEARAVPLAN